jgi:hypothetical protein
MGVGQRSAEIHLVLSDARLITMNGTANHNRQLCACFASTCVARLSPNPWMGRLSDRRVNSENAF